MTDSAPAAFDMVLRTRRGSLLVEAAFVYPILIILVVGMISWGADHYIRVHVDVSQKLENREQSMHKGTMKKKEAEWIRGIDAIEEVLR